MPKNTFDTHVPYPLLSAPPEALRHAQIVMSGLEAPVCGGSKVSSTAFRARHTRISAAAT